MNGDEVREFHETFGSPIKDGLVEFPGFEMPGKPRKSRILSICLLPTALRCLLMSWKGQQINFYDENRDLRIQFGC